MRCLPDCLYLYYEFIERYSTQPVFAGSYLITENTLINQIHLFIDKQKAVDLVGQEFPLGQTDGTHLRRNRS